MKRKHFLTTIIVLLAILASTTPMSFGDTTTSAIHFIDVGQGDAIFVDLPNNNDILIDGGPRASRERLLAYLKTQTIDDFELIVATHPDEDHIGGLPPVYAAYAVEKTIDASFDPKTNIYKEYVAPTKAEGVRLPTADTSLTFGTATFQVFVPVKTGSKTNDRSLLCRLDLGDIELMFAGDATTASEATFLSKKPSVKSEILKVAHHGSAGSSSKAFLEAVDPDFAVIFCGANNTYKHPHAAAMDRLRALSITSWRTDYYGNIIIRSDGKTYSKENSKRPAENTPLITPTAPTVAPTVPPTQPITNMVYVTQTGTKYHRSGCQYLSANPIAISLSEAQAQGYTPCSVCN